MVLLTRLPFANTCFCLGLNFCNSLCLVTKLYLTLCDPMDCSLPGSSIHGIFPGKNTGEGCHFLLHGIFPSQGLNLGLLHCRWVLYRATRGNPTILYRLYFMNLSTIKELDARAMLFS